jgi:hypothetical protein
MKRGHDNRFLKKYVVLQVNDAVVSLTLSPTALGPIGPRVFKGIQLKA